MVTLFCFWDINLLTLEIGLISSPDIGEVFELCLV
jgi:hypothetical protein